jgi:ABC-type Fe3+/spermidine/putrescine transport system ATPase subunit
MSAAPIVTLEQVTKSFGSFVALHEIDLAIAEGEFVTLLGPSGCGKTTTLRLIGGFDSVDRGRIRIAGADVTDAPAYRRPVNTVFQEYALFPHMSVEANVGYGLSVKAQRVPAAERKQRVADALAMVGLSDKARQMPGQLSGGQRQRVAMARALVRRPKVLLLDEPLSALDVKLREAMQVELKHLHQQLGITFLMVTHDQSEALALSDRVVVMRSGRIAQIGAPAVLYDRPANAYVADFVGAMNLIDGRISGLSGGIAEVRLPDNSLVRGAPAPDSALAIGAAATVGIRPERLRLANGADDASIPVTLIGRLFHGNTVRLETRLDGWPKPVFVELQRASARAPLTEPAIGAGLRIAAAEEDVVIYPAESVP